MRHARLPALPRFPRAVPIVVGLLAISAPAEATPLRAAEIGDLVSGAVVHIDTPLGSPLQLTYHADGTLAGSAGKLAFYLGSPHDRGRWWIADDRLCQRWTRWFDAEVSCLSLRRQGNRFAWQREDGKQGTASIVSVERPVVVANAVEILPRPRSLGGPPVEPPTAAPVLPVRQAALPSAALPVAAVRQPAQITSRRVPVRSAEPAPGPGLRPGSPSPSRPLVVTYRVANVRPDDQLNVRRGPSHRAPVLAAVPHDGHRITLRGTCVGDWCPIRYRTTLGWVNRMFLALEPITAPPIRQASRR